MIEVEESIYDHPQYYDLIFAAEWEPEFNFLEACFEQYAEAEVVRLFEPACGTGRLIHRFAEAGYEISGNDLNANAIEFCNERLTMHGLQQRAVVGDMTKFTLHQPVQAAFNTINSFRHLNTEKLAVKHLNCMADAIVKGGIYVLGFHLSPIGIDACEEEYWSAEEGGIRVDSSMWLKERDTRRRIETLGMAFDVQTPDKKLRIVDELKFRTYTWLQFERLIDKVPRLELIEVFDFDYDIANPMAVDQESEDAVFVFKVR
jgi:SAM-dependent methyltransferase